MSHGPDTLNERLNNIRQRIAEIANACGRAPDSIRLIAVSKTHSVEDIELAMAAGQRDFGENVVQEALPKIERVRPREAMFHFIGHLQSNKAKFIPGNFAWLHSLDSVPLATRLERLCAERGVSLNALIEVNVTRDPRKHGVLPEQLDPLLDSLTHQSLTHLTLRGLMTIGPHTLDTRARRDCFARLRELRASSAERFGLAQFNQLSMGMSDDYPEAITEGATMVRIGTAIFGARDYSA